MAEERAAMRYRQHLYELETREDALGRHERREEERLERQWDLQRSTRSWIDRYEQLTRGMPGAPAEVVQMLDEWGRQQSLLYQRQDELEAAVQKERRILEDRRDEIEEQFHEELRSARKQGDERRLG
jgi:hypothetical protein